VNVLPLLRIQMVLSSGLPRVSDRVLIGNPIYWTLLPTTRVYALQIPITHKVSTVTFSLVVAR
jgi:hypothetical protein